MKKTMILLLSVGITNAVDNQINDFSIEESSQLSGNDQDLNIQPVPKEIMTKIDVVNKDLQNNKDKLRIEMLELLMKKEYPKGEFEITRGQGGAQNDGIYFIKRFLEKNKKPVLMFVVKFLHEKGDMQLMRNSAKTEIEALNLVRKDVVKKIAAAPYDIKKYLPIIRLHEYAYRSDLGIFILIHPARESQETTLLNFPHVKSGYAEGSFIGVMTEKRQNISPKEWKTYWHSDKNTGNVFFNDKKIEWIDVGSIKEAKLGEIMNQIIITNGANLKGCYAFFHGLRKALRDDDGSILEGLLECIPTGSIKFNAILDKINPVRETAIVELLEKTHPKAPDIQPDPMEGLPKNVQEHKMQESNVEESLISESIGITNQQNVSKKNLDESIVKSQMAQSQETVDSQQAESLDMDKIKKLNSYDDEAADGLEFKPLNQDMY